MLFLSPTPSYAKKLGQNGPQTGFYRGGHKTPPPTALDAFDRVRLVGLKDLGKTNQTNQK